MRNIGAIVGKWMALRLSMLGSRLDALGVWPTTVQRTSHRYMPTSEWLPICCIEEKRPVALRLRLNGS